MVLNDDIRHVYEKLLSKYIPACVYEIVELYIIGINTKLRSSYLSMYKTFGMKKKRNIS